MDAEAPPPAARLLAAHVAGVRFRAGEDIGRWGIVGSSPSGRFPDWPKVMFWVQAARREGGPDRFHFLFDVTNYPADAPTAHLADKDTKACLPAAKRPKGRDRVALVFRTDWNGGTALYHPYDRIAADSHKDWPAKHPHLVWTPAHTVCDLLSELHNLLQSEEYTHV